MMSSSSSSEKALPLRKLKIDRKRSRTTNARTHNRRFPYHKRTQSVAKASVKYPRSHDQLSAMDLQTLNDVPLQFQDDKTGKKNIRPSALRHSLKIVENEARRITESVVRNLIENNQVEESQRVQFRSSQHERKIVQQVRDKLHKTAIPVRYVRIGDVVLDELETVNEKRMEEMEVCRRQLRRLEERKSISLEERKAAKQALNDVQLDSVGRLSHPVGMKTHPLLKELTEKSNENSPEPSNISTLKGYKCPENEEHLFSILLGKLPSKYN